MQDDVFFVVYRFYFFCQPEKDPRHIELETYLFQSGIFCVFWLLTCQQNSLYDIQNGLLAFLPERIAILLGHGEPVRIQRFVQVVRFFENRNVKFINGMKIHNDIFKRIISLENLFCAWDEFKKDKRKKKDVMRFEWRLEENIFRLHYELRHKHYRHEPYTSFYITDPKVRHIHKATVRDRILHHAMFAVLNPLFEPSFIPHSFSCQIGKGMHRGVNVLERMLRQESHNHTKPCFALKCDIQKFFGSVDHDILFSILVRRIQDDDALWLIKEIIGSFRSENTTIFERKGLPIGNLTSQLFANIYLNELDQYVKHILRAKKYVRYTDDFVIISEDYTYLANIIMPLREFLANRLLLNLHPRKMTIRKFSQGIDFLGYVVLPRYRVLRTKTERRIFRKLHLRTIDFRNGNIRQETLKQSLQSYLGVLSHANAYLLSQELQNHFWYWQNE